MDDNGVASCWDVKTGKRVLEGAARAARAPRLGGRRRRPHLLHRRRGRDVRGEGSDEFELLAKNPLGEKVFASPAFSDGDIFIRGAKHLWCIGEEAVSDSIDRIPAP